MFHTLFIVVNLGAIAQTHRWSICTSFAHELSYFLWGSMPDNTLFDLAAQDKLRDRAVVQEQTVRMLKDPRSRAVSRFLRSVRKPPHRNWAHCAISESVLRFTW